MQNRGSMIGQELVSRGRAGRFADQIARLNAGASTKGLTMNEKIVLNTKFDPVVVLSPRRVAKPD
jgi:hypothetical protein